MPTTRPGPAAARSRQRVAVRRRRRRLTLLLVLALVVTGGWFGVRAVVQSIAGPQCTITAAGMTETFDPEQTGNAALIAALAVKRNLPPRAATIALTTSLQESKIRNLRFGDRDSLGLFQQRPSQGWGTEDQILDPVHATNAFYDALVKYPGYETADITKIAQRVQKSGFPEAYRDHEGQGRVLASSLTGHSPAGLTCRLDAVKGTPATPRQVASDLAQQMGVTGVRTGDGYLTVTTSSPTTAWAVAQWAVARADLYGATKVTIGDRAWNRSSGDKGWSPGRDGTTVTVNLG